MVKFTTTDYLSTAPKLDRRPRPSRLVIPSSTLRLPIAPPSPYFDGMNTVINTEPFPDFSTVLDLEPVEKAEPLHCVLHCQNSVCRTMVRAQSALPPCRCAFEKTRDEPEYVPSLGPPLLENMMEKFGEIGELADGQQNIVVVTSDVLPLLADLANYSAACALRDEDLRMELRSAFTGQDVAAAIEVSEMFFRGMRTYFNRTLCTLGGRNLTVHQLRSEVDVYIWTMYREWVSYHYDDATVDQLTCDGGLRGIVLHANYGAPGAVLRFWQECAYDVVGLVVWRDDEARRRIEEDGLKVFVLGQLGVYLLALGITPLLLG